MKTIPIKNICTSCNNIQDVKEEEVYQDVKGKYFICNGKGCNKIYSIEPVYE